MSSEPQAPRYAVGIDLGTTNCVISYVDLQSDSELKANNDSPVNETLSVMQLTAPGAAEEKSQLPSFYYLPHDDELSEDDKHLPWASSATGFSGILARNLGSKTPLRLVASAKSWLGHSVVNAREAFLPLNSPDEVAKISPFEATRNYLQHLSDAWRYKFPEYDLAQQDVTITVPASFDPAARELTAEAARELGLQHLTLLEEPQAAVYHWLKEAGEDWREQVNVGDIILVVDIGGGTTDLSLIAVAEEEGNLALNRIAVGDHILLGGDNMDLALAYTIKNKLAQQGKQLQPWQIQAIVHSCRDAKEALLQASEVQSYPIVVPARGSKMLGGTLSTELTREDVSQALVEGFFPPVDIHEHPRQQTRGALTQMGLPYAQDAAVTRHLAAFLCRQSGAAGALFGAGEGEFIKPTAVLFNGGVLKADIVEDRVISIINDWLREAGAEPVRLLQGADLDLAVARGSSYYGYVRKGKGVRIRGGIASTFYVGIESAMPAVPGMEPPIEAICVAPFGMEEGTVAEMPAREFGLVVGEPVKFRFFGSTVRRDDQPGTHLEYWEPGELDELPEIQLTLPEEGRTPGEVVPVRLASRVTEVGTLCLEAIPRDSSARWQVEFDVRNPA